MTLFEIVAFYVALNLLILCVLVWRVASYRIAHKVSMGSGQDKILQARVRAHGNFIETTPMALIGLLMLAALSAPPVMLHLFGGGFTIGRIAHINGMSGPHGVGPGRRIGMVLTLLVFIGMTASLFYLIFAAQPIS